MTNDKMFDEIGCPDELKKCKEEIKRHKKHIEKPVSYTHLTLPTTPYV